MNEQRYAANIVYRVYPAFWMRFCKITELEIREIAVFKDGDLIGLNIPIPEDKEKFLSTFEKKFINVEKISESDDPVRHMVVKHGAFFFDVYFFEKNISIEVNIATNPRLIR